MSLNKQSGNMYPWVTHTWNPLKGECCHKCDYCYIRNTILDGDKYEGEIGLIDNFEDEYLGDGKRIFVCSAQDLFGIEVPHKVIDRVIEEMKAFRGNEYLLQSKNPQKMSAFVNDVEDLEVIYGTTIETEEDVGVWSEVTPVPEQRYEWIKTISDRGYRTMVSVEPIMDFRICVMSSWLKRIDPEFVIIGADSKQTEIEEPSGSKIEQLYELLKYDGIEVKLKSNLKRLWDYEESEIYEEADIDEL